MPDPTKPNRRREPLDATFQRLQRALDQSFRNEGRRAVERQEFAENEAVKELAQRVRGLSDDLAQVVSAAASRVREIEVERASRTTVVAQLESDLDAFFGDSATDPDNR